MKTKITRLLSLFVALVLFLGTAPTARTIEPLNRLSAADATERSLSGLAARALAGQEDEPFGAVGAPSVPSVIQSTTGDWQIECVDCPKQFSNMTDRSLRLDTEGHPHIAYGEDHLYYAWHDGMRWYYETVDESPQVGQYASLTLDGADLPHISYYDYFNEDLKYAWYDGMTWHIETVDSEGRVGEYTSLALDRMGRPHISYGYCHQHDYYGCGDSNLKHAWHDGTTWHVETVDSDGYVGPYTSLALDGADRPHISYSDQSNHDLKYAWYDGMAWHIETVDSGGAVGLYTSLALDGLDRPHIGYYDSTNDDLKYTWHDGSRWHVETVDSEGDVGKHVSLALDGSDRPHLSYYDHYTNYNLKYTWHDGMDWHIETVDIEGDVGAYTSLALDEAGHPHVSYYDLDNYDLKYTWYDSMNWHTEMVDDERHVGSSISMALDGTGYPHISYFDQSNDDLKYAWYDGIEWYIETVDSEGSVGSYTSLALDGADQPHISYYDSTNGDLKYAWYDGMNWHIEIVDSEGDVGLYTSLALDGASRPHISYTYINYTDQSYSQEQGLKYAWRSGVDYWHVEVVDTEGWGETSLVLDEESQPHIAYVAYVVPNLYADQLKYAWRDGTSWHTEMTKDYADSSISLALDRMGQPHIGYISYDYFHGLWSSLGYAWHDGKNWHSEEITGTYDYLGLAELSSASLALNRAGQPHTSYSSPDWSDVASSDLTYAWRDRTGWHTEKVDRKGHNLNSTSLALDGVGRPHIGYQADGGLKYAWLRPSLALDKYATSGNSVCNDDILTYTLAFAGLGSSARLWDPLPSAVRYTPGSITSTVTPTAIYSPTVHGIIWQGTLPTDTIQTVRFQAALGITAVKSLLSPLPIANTAWMTTTESGRSISATTTVTIPPRPLSLYKQAAPRDNLHNNDILTYTLTLYGPDLDVRLRDPLPSNVRYVSGSLTDTIGSISGTLALPAAVYSPTAHAILWQGTLPTDTVEVVRFQVAPGITGTGSLLLSLPIVNTAWLTATESGRSVSSTVIVNGYDLHLPLMLRQFQ